MRLIAYTDGAARGNPGPAAYGAVVLGPDGGELRALAKTIGRATNNVAEYRGAIAAVEAALELGATRLDLYMDSELIVRQLEGRYRARNAKLKPLFGRLSSLIDRLDEFSVHHVPRGENARADELANAALDGRKTKARKRATRTRPS